MSCVGASVPCADGVARFSASISPAHDGQKTPAAPLSGEEVDAAEPFLYTHGAPRIVELAPWLRNH